MSYPNDNHVLAEDVWIKDKEKIDNLLYNENIDDILIIWEEDYRNDDKAVVEKCNKVFTDW